MSNHANVPQSIREQQDALADTAFESYDFGEGVQVESHGHWDVDSYDGMDDFTKVAYVRCDDDAPDAETHKVSFHVKFVTGTLQMDESYGYWCETGVHIGSPQSNPAPNESCKA